MLALMQRLKDQLELVIVQVENSLLQVADAAMDQLGALGRGSCCIVFTLHKGCAEAPASATCMKIDCGSIADNQSTICTQPNCAREVT